MAIRAVPRRLKPWRFLPLTHFEKFCVLVFNLKHNQKYKKERNDNAYYSADVSKLWGTA